METATLVMIGSWLFYFAASFELFGVAGNKRQAAYKKLGWFKRGGISIWLTIATLATGYWIVSNFL